MREQKTRSNTINVLMELEETSLVKFSYGFLLSGKDNISIQEIQESLGSSLSLKFRKKIIELIEDFDYLRVDNISVDIQCQISPSTFEPRYIFKAGLVIAVPSKRFAVMKIRNDELPELKKVFEKIRIYYENGELQFLP